LLKFLQIFKIMLKKILISLIFSLLCFQILFAQNEDFSIYRPKYTFERELLKEKGKVLEITLDSDSLAQKTDITALINKWLDYIPPVYVGIKGNFKRIEGWRVQIYRGRSREEASKARQRSYEIFPNATPYMMYSSPTYRVRVGDFLEPHEYQALLKRLKRTFPNAVAVPDIVNIVLLKRDTGKL